MYFFMRPMKLRPRKFTSIEQPGMRLTVQEFPIAEVVIGEQTTLDGALLTVGVGDLRAAIENESQAIAAVHADIAHPGESARIIHVLDAAEAMTKIEGPGTVYPGFVGPPIIVGSGVTNKLTGMLVLSTTEFPELLPGGLRFREGIIDMLGPGQPYCQASEAIDLVLTFDPAPGVTNRDLDDAIRRVTLRFCNFLGMASIGSKPATTKIYELESIDDGLPRVACIDQIMSQTFMARTFVYGQEMNNTLPTVMHPNELIDGAIVTGNYKNLQKVATYLHCNKPVMMEMYRRHGVDLNFVGVVVNQGHRETQALKDRAAQFSAKVAKMLNAQGVVVSFEGGGSATMDFMFTIGACERLGIRSVGEMYEHAFVGSGETPIVFDVPEANALISRGAEGEVIQAPAVHKLMGGSTRLELYNGQVIEDAAQAFSAYSNDYWGVDYALGKNGFRAREY
jgi:sarcosine reductase